MTFDPPLAERTLTAALDRAVDTQPDGTFLRWAEGSMSYGAFEELANAAARGLVSLGVEPGHKVAIMLGNGVEFVAAMVALARLGAVYVPINTDYIGAILEHQLNKAEVTHIIADAIYLGRIGEVRRGVPRLGWVVVVGDDARDACLDTRVSHFAELIAHPGRRPTHQVDYRDPLAISFTSGTTGPSKGVMATHCHVVSFALDWIEACRVTPADRLYTCLPMFHAIATWLGVIPAILAGTSIAFAPKFSASRFWDDVRAFDATVVHGIFAMIPMLLKQPPRSDDVSVPARLFYIGQRNAEFEARFNCRIVEVYGATETGIVTYSPLDEPGRPGSCGRANARTYEVAIVDDADQPVPVETAGEIVVRPRQPYSMIQEYYGMPAETLAAFRNLWFHTGDNAKVDAEGYLYFVDRKKDAIRRRGENISSYELENVVIGDDRVLECAAVAVPSELGEDEVKMVIVARPDTQLDAAAIWKLCDQRMPRFWVPRFVEFRQELPKTPNGKVQKYLLRGEAGGQIYDRQARAGHAA
jgi:crotonobetaine/carnitine-CoA ligase